MHTIFYIPTTEQWRADGFEYVNKCPVLQGKKFPTSMKALQSRWMSQQSDPS